VHHASENLILFLGVDFGSVGVLVGFQGAGQTGVFAFERDRAGFI
jgi:hypothetical protein